jgi:hypothetical protein
LKTLPDDFVGFAADEQLAFPKSFFESADPRSTWKSDGGVERLAAQEIDPCAMKKTILGDQCSR